MQLGAARALRPRCCMQYCSSRSQEPVAICPQFSARSSSHELRMYSLHATTTRTPPARTQLAYSLCREDLRRWMSGG
jgi:hypothetical protein